MVTPTFDASSFQRLAERTEYEDWLLEAVYAIVEQKLFPGFPDGVVYPVDSSEAELFFYARSSTSHLGWQGGFLNAGAPFVFVSLFKVLDMLIEWILEENGYRPNFRFQYKIEQIKGLSFIFPSVIETRSWLKDRLIGLYEFLEPLRGTIIHDKHFTATNGTIQVSSTKGGNIGPVVSINAGELRILARVIVSVPRYVDQTWQLDDFLEKRLRYDLDKLAALHRVGLLDQRLPLHKRVRVYTTDPDPLHIDLAKIWSDQNMHRADREISIDLRVLIVKDGTAVGAYFFPWPLLAPKGFGWSQDINCEQYQSDIPDDIEPKHLRTDAG